MGTNPTKAAGNIYCQCRKEAAKYNDKLNSREGAAEVLGMSSSTLSDYELGITKIIPARTFLEWLMYITHHSLRIITARIVVH